MTAAMAKLKYTRPRPLKRPERPRYYTRRPNGTFDLRNSSHTPFNTVGVTDQMVDAPNPLIADDRVRYFRMANGYAMRGVVDMLQEREDTPVMPAVPEPKQTRPVKKAGGKTARKASKRVVSTALARARGRK